MLIFNNTLAYEEPVSIFIDASQLVESMFMVH